MVVIKMIKINKYLERVSIEKSYIKRYYYKNLNDYNNYNLYCSVHYCIKTGQIGNLFYGDFEIYNKNKLTNEMIYRAILDMNSDVEKIYIASYINKDFSEIFPTFIDKNLIPNKITCSGYIGNFMDVKNKVEENINK